MMTQRAQSKHSLYISGVVDITDGHITISVADKGEFDLADFMKAFDRKECEICISYEEMYIPDDKVV